MAFNNMIRDPNLKKRDQELERAMKRLTILIGAWSIGIGFAVGLVFGKVGGYIMGIGVAATAVVLATIVVKRLQLIREDQRLRGF